LSEAYQYILELPLRRAEGRQDFFVSASNVEAVSWIDRWPEWPFQSLVIAGEMGSGKSHLAAVWQKQSGAALLRAENFPRSYSELMEEGHAGPWIIDGLETVVARDGGEECLFHLINHARSQALSLLFLSEKRPALLGIELRDLRSRLLAMTTVSINQPDDELVTALYQKLFAERQIKVDEGVIRFLLAYADRDFATIQLLVSELDKRSLSQKRAVTVPLVRAVLTDQ
jgi:chromosomal replication initiation ATPase DnaA